MNVPTKVLQDVKQQANAEIAGRPIASASQPVDDTRNVAMGRPRVGGGGIVAQPPKSSSHSTAVPKAEIVDEFDIDVGDFDDADLSFADQDDSQSVPDEDEVAAILNNVYADDAVPVEIEHIAPEPDTGNGLEENFDQDAAALVERPPIEGGRGRGQSRLPLNGARGRDLSAELDSAALSDDADQAVDETRTSFSPDVDVPESHAAHASRSTSAAVTRASPPSSDVALETAADSIPDPQERFAQLQVRWRRSLVLAKPATIIALFVTQAVTAPGCDVRQR